MPELPEVETVRRGLERFVVGHSVHEVVVTGTRSVRRQHPDELVAALRGRQLRAARRWGKYLWIDLADKGAPPGAGVQSVLVCHLRMSGQLLKDAPPLRPPPPHTHVRLVLDDGSELRFVDPRTFGELFVTDELDLAGRPGMLARLGPDPLIEGIDACRLGELAAIRRVSLKAFLLDQKVLAGIGNLYADEICFAARLRPSRLASSLRGIEVGRLVAASIDVLSAAVAARGSTLRDARYVDLLGEAGHYQDHHAVYGRAGEPCPRCGRPILRTRLAGRSAHYCARCQR